MKKKCPPVLVRGREAHKVQYSNSNFKYFKSIWLNPHMHKAQVWRADYMIDDGVFILQQQQRLIERDSVPCSLFTPTTYSTPWQGPKYIQTLC